MTEQSAPEQNEKVDIDTFKRADIRIGEIQSAEKVADADKLLKLIVWFGGEEKRQIVSGIAEYFPDPSALVGKRVAFAYNLQPRIIRGLESDGMILAAVDGDGAFSLLETHAVTPGARIR